jgi:hypothetical protein
VTEFYCLNCKLVFGKHDFFLFKSRGSPTLKYINDVIDHKAEAGIYIQFIKRCFHNVKLAKTKIILRSSAHTFISMSHTYRWRSVSCCWDMHWQFCAWLRKSRGTTCCTKAEFNVVHLLFMDEYEYPQLIIQFVYRILSS